jgi:hypothetical protein
MKNACTIQYNKRKLALFRSALNAVVSAAAVVVVVVVSVVAKEMV